MLAKEIIVKIWGDSGEIVQEETFHEESTAWAFAEHFLFLGNEVTIIPSMLCARLDAAASAD